MKDNHWTIKVVTFETSLFPTDRHHRYKTIIDTVIPHLKQCSSTSFKRNEVRLYFLVSNLKSSLDPFSFTSSSCFVCVRAICQTIGLVETTNTTQREEGSM